MMMILIIFNQPAGSPQVVADLLGTTQKMIAGQIVTGVTMVIADQTMARDMMMATVDQMVMVTMAMMMVVMVAMALMDLMIMMR